MLSVHHILQDIFDVLSYFPAVAKAAGIEARSLVGCRFVSG
jgi:hypothetical protein